MRNFLPERFQFSHDFAMYLHDYIASILVYGETNKLFVTNFKVEDNYPDNDKHIFEWLETHNRPDILGEVLLKAIFPALLSDFCHFIYEALTCSRKGKLTVSYALLRKPLRESLHYLEWLLADPEDFLNTLYNEESKALSRFSNSNRIKKIINDAISKCPNSKLFSAEHIYRLRFDKTASFGFDGMCNRAIHLITTKVPIATERRNLNFIFSNNDARESQWELIYGQLPYLLFYASNVIDVLISIINGNPLQDFAHTNLHRLFGFIVWQNELPNILEGYKNTKNENKPFNCFKCNTPIFLEIEKIRALFEYQEIACPSCHSILNFDSFI